MLTILVAALALLQGGPLDAAGIYTAVLREVGTSYPGLPVVLADTRTVECMPHCGAQLREPDQNASPEEQEAARPDVHWTMVIQRLRERGLITGTCRVEPGTFGCDGHPGHLFVGLGAIDRAPRNGPPPVENAFWVKVAVLAPCITPECRIPEGLGWWFLVEPDRDGGWSVVRRLPAFAI